MKSYRIISMEACEICRQEQINGESVGYALPHDHAALLELFKNKLDASLDTLELERVYAGLCKKPFSFSDQYGNDYTLSVVNLKFNRVYPITPREPVETQKKKRKKGTYIGTEELRERYYERGFCIDGVRFVRYKRSAGSSRDGNCLFIDERLIDTMKRWGECGLVQGGDIASWEAYKSLSLSSVKGMVRIPIDGILFVDDYKDTFTDDVVSVEFDGKQLVASYRKAEITNDIWDGESLLDESIFAGQYADKHMLLLRNKFFKSCAFRTKLQKWIKDKHITLDDLKARGCVTLATDIGQMIMVTTPNSFKYLKFAGGLTEGNLQRWAEHADDQFGVVKWDKRTRYFGGRMVRSSYQVLNTVGMSREEADALIDASIRYVHTIRGDIDFMRYHFSDVCTREPDESWEDEEDGITQNECAQRAKVLFRLMQINNAFRNTELYVDFRNDVVKSQKDGLLAGHILLYGTNATLFGNGPELLKRIAGEKMGSSLPRGQIRCSRFPHGQRLLCARSPHITMGNLYLATNNLEGEIWNYFDLGENIVCVNAMGENLQQTLNGCDYDSDTMLVTDDRMLINRAEHYAKRFRVPFCNIPSKANEELTLAKLDHNTSVNKIGEIVNLSQKLNSIIWDRLYHGDGNIDEIYLDACKLAILSGIEIDKAKRAYDNIHAGRELDLLRRKYESCLRPEFFLPIDVANDRKHSRNRNTDDEGARREYYNYDTPMQYLYGDAAKIDFRFGKAKEFCPVPVSSMLKQKARSVPEDIKACKQILALCSEYRQKIGGEYTKLSGLDEDERDVVYKNILDLKTERNQKIEALLQNENILLLVIQGEEERAEKIRAEYRAMVAKSGQQKRAKERARREAKAIATDWYIYGPLLDCDTFCRMLDESKEKLATIVEDPQGPYTLYKFHYRKE